MIGDLFKKKTIREVIYMEKKNNIQKKSISYAKWGYIFIAPFFIIYAIFTLYPQMLTIYNSFFEYYRDGLTIVGPNYVGLANYKALFTTNSQGIIPLFKFLGNTVVQVPTIFLSASYKLNVRLPVASSGKVTSTTKV